MQILYFAWVREKIGMDGESPAPPEGVQTVGALIEWLRTLTPGHAEALADTSRLRVAVDQKFVGMDGALAGAAEVAIFPPVTGG